MPACICFAHTHAYRWSKRTLVYTCCTHKHTCRQTKSWIWYLGGETGEPKKHSFYWLCLKAVVVNLILCVIVKQICIKQIYIYIYIKEAFINTAWLDFRSIRFGHTTWKHKQIPPFSSVNYIGFFHGSLLRTQSRPDHTAGLLPPLHCEIEWTP